MLNNGPYRLLRRDEQPSSPAERARKRIMSSMRIRRAISGFIDLQLANFVCVLLMRLVLPYFGIDGIKNMIEWGFRYKGYYPHPVLAASYLVLMLLKDIMRSPGKCLMKLKLTGSRGGVPVWKRVLRNLTVVIWPVEAVLLLVSGRRLTDWILGINVTDAAETSEKTEEKMQP